MLPKTQKLTRVLFPKHTEPKKTWVGDCLRIQYSYTNQVSKSRFAVVVSKKIHALAVRRNSIKRAIYEGIEHCGDILAIGRGMKIVIFPGKKDELLLSDAIVRDLKIFFAFIKWST